MSKEAALNEVDKLLAPNTPPVRKSAHRKMGQKVIEELTQDFNNQITAITPTLLNFFAEGVDTMAETNISLQGIKVVGGLDGRENMLVFTPFQNNLSERRIWRMKGGTQAWEAVEVPSFYQLIVQVNSGSNAGRLFIQVSRTTPLEWKNFGRLQGLGNWSKYDYQSVTGSTTSKDGDIALNSALSYSFVGKVEVKLWGVSMEVYDGTQSFQQATCYFCIGNSTTPRKNGELQPGDVLRWNGSKYAQLEGSEKIKITGVLTTLQTREPGLANEYYKVTFTERELTAMASGPDTRLIIHNFATGGRIYKWDGPNQILRTLLDF